MNTFKASYFYVEMREYPEARSWSPWDLIEDTLIEKCFKFWETLFTMRLSS